MNVIFRYYILTISMLITHTYNITNLGLVCFHFCVYLKKLQKLLHKLCMFYEFFLCSENNNFHGSYKMFTCEDCDLVANLSQIVAKLKHTINVNLPNFDLFCFYRIITMAFVLFLISVTTNSLEKIKKAK